MFFSFDRDVTAPESKVFLFLYALCDQPDLGVLIITTVCEACLVVVYNDEKYI